MQFAAGRLNERCGLLDASWLWPYERILKCWLQRDDVVPDLGVLLVDDVVGMAWDLLTEAVLEDLHPSVVHRGLFF